MLDGALMVKVTDEAEPDDGTLPVPVQPVQRYLAPPDWSAGVVTDAVIVVPVSNQLLAGVGKS